MDLINLEEKYLLEELGNSSNQEILGVYLS